MAQLYEEIDESLLSPMMKIYLETKRKYMDCILFYRLGDFYEMFFDDALTASKVLEITLTGKECGLKERAPMCGVPFHSVDGYLNRLVNAGYKVAVAEQLEDPKLAKGLVKRDVIRIVTPGTITDSMALEEGKNNFLISVCAGQGAERVYGFAAADLTTGVFFVTELSDETSLKDEVLKYAPAEFVFNSLLEISGFSMDFLDRETRHVLRSGLDDWYFEADTCKSTLLEHYHAADLSALGLGDMKEGVLAAGALLKYLYETQKDQLTHFTAISPYSNSGFMRLDSATRRNLELTETMREKNKRGSLLWVLDKTKTAMGARTLREMVEQPLVKTEAIKARQDVISAMLGNYIAREELREYLSPVYDLERLMGRISMKTANPRDLIALKTSLSMLPPIVKIVSELLEGEEDIALLRSIMEGLDPLEDLCSLIEESIVDEPPFSVREGGMIRPGYSEEADRLRELQQGGKEWITTLEESERARTGIPKLKVGFNKVFGYYIEVTNSYKNMVPDDYTRKQTLTTGERYITPELKEMENTILGAQDKLYSLEYDLFCSVRDTIGAEVVRIQKTARSLAILDALASLAVVAERNHYVRPDINESDEIRIKEGRHPVVEAMLSGDLFISNDVSLNCSDHRMLIITGPNMAGKSTYMRQVALITLMAQIGSYVPALEASIGICDRIFTRVGASDDLSSGQSTFMVEMTEVANIIRNATSRSLIILDEIGRGTSTFDGLSIAWAVCDYISDREKIGARTLFATHYHELTELEGVMDGVSNYCIAVKEDGENIVFLRKIVKGGADKSYGIQVARLAGVPSEVTDRAEELLAKLTSADINLHAKEVISEQGALMTSSKRESSETKRAVDTLESSFVQNDFFTLMDRMKQDQEADGKEQILKKMLEEKDLSRMTPIEALNFLYEMKDKL